MQWSDDGLSQRRLSYDVTIRFQHKPTKPSKSKHADLKIMNLEKRPIKAEEPTSKTRRQLDQPHEPGHIIGIVGENRVLNCSMLGK